MKSKVKRVAILLICIVPITFWCFTIRDDFQGPIKLADFSTLYFGARCAIHRGDPYSRTVFFQELVKDHISFAAGAGVPEQELHDFSGCVYPPTALAFMLPFALLPWGIAQDLFICFTAASIAIAGLLAWDLASKSAPVLAGCMVCYLVSSSMLVLLLGNPAGFVTGFCVIAAGCFLKKRCEAAGVVLLALALVIKPHDAGFIWLYFLLAGGTGRKRAWQTLALVAVLAACAATWMAPLSPHWIQEASRNRAVTATRGTFNDPGPSGPSYTTVFPDVSLQSLLSNIDNNPHFYNPAGYLLGGGMILIWAAMVLGKGSRPEQTSLALAAISILSLLAVYHRSYDAKLMLLMVPGFAAVWAAKGARRWIAVGLTAAAIVVTSDVFLLFLVRVTSGITISPSTLHGKMMLLMLRPAPPVLLAAGCFYLWVFIRPRSSAAAKMTIEVRAATETPAV